MAQHDYNIANQAGAAFRSDTNNGFAAIVSQNSGATEPATMFAYMWWADTTTGLLKVRNAGNTAWVTVGTLASAYFGLARAGTNTDILSLGGLTTALSRVQGGVGLVTNTALADAAATLTAAQLLTGQFTITPTVARILTPPTATDIIALLQNYQVGSHFKFSIQNNAAFDVTLTTNTGVTLEGNMVVNNGNKVWRCRIDSSTTVTIRAEADAMVAAAVVTTAAGTVSMYAGSTAPSGYLLCDGAAVSRTTYAALFTAISTTWGAGDGTTTFNVPDARGRAPIGVGNGSGLTARALAATGGAETHTLTTGQMPAHTHTYSNPIASVLDSFNWASGTGSELGSPSTGSTGGGGAHNNMQPFAAFNFIIKT